MSKTWQKAAAYYLKLSEQRLNTMIIPSSSPVSLFRQSELALAWKSGRAGPAPFVIGHGGPVRQSLAKRHARLAEANTKAACKAVPRCKPTAAQLHPTKLEPLVLGAGAQVAFKCRLGRRRKWGALLRKRLLEEVYLVPGQHGDTLDRYEASKLRRRAQPHVKRRRERT